jgi:hypothetical protein
MTDDIVTRMRVKASRCTHGNERYYNGPEGIDAYLIDTCSWCYSWNEAADEIERLRECLQHAIDHVGKWQLFTSEERQTILAEYEQVVRGE